MSSNRMNSRWDEFVSVEEYKKNEVIPKKGHFSIKKLILLLLAIFIVVMLFWGEPIMPYLDRYIQMAIERVQNLLS